MKLEALILSAVLAIPMAMMGQSMGNQNTNTNAYPKSNKNMTEMSTSDQHFLCTLAQEDHSEIDLARLALKKSTNPKVQEYAKSKILAADPSMEQQARTIAQQDNENISNTTNKMEKNECDKLSKLSGTQFDKEYMKYEAWKQEKDLGSVRQEITSTKNQTVKDYARKEEPPVKQAAQSAEQIATSLGVQTTASSKY
jgi:putative membrane protein